MRRIDELRKDTTELSVKNQTLVEEKKKIDEQISASIEKQHSVVVRHERINRNLKYSKLRWERSYEHNLRKVFQSLDELKAEKRMKYAGLRKTYIPKIESFLEDETKPVVPPYVDEYEKQSNLNPQDGFDRLRKSEYDFNKNFHSTKDETISFRLIITANGQVIHTEVIASQSTNENREKLHFLDRLIKNNIRYSFKQDAGPEYVYLTVNLKTDE